MSKFNVKSLAGSWSNTGGNGPASEVWVRAFGDMTAQVERMPHRSLATLFFGGSVDEDHEGVPFPTVAEAKAWCEAFAEREERTAAENRRPENRDDFGR